MISPLIPRRDLDFLVFDWLAAGSRAVGADVIDDRETLSAVLDLSEHAAHDLFLPHYRQADLIEPRIVNGQVEVLPAVKEALQQYAELGLFGTSFPTALGGMGLSQLTASAVFALFASANVSTAVYPMLTVANARLIARFGTEAQVAAFARPQIEGRWFGTMCLSEPQAGSSLGDVTTRAVEVGDDDIGIRYQLKGHKTWISGGDQNASANIVHLVLAKIVQADGKLAEGSKGTSLFVVPKFLPDGARNDVVVAGLNHKMGFRGTSNCLLNLGEQDGAVGWRVGEPGQGLAIMFQMMNEARIGTGLAAAALGVRSYRHSLAYARERTQGRAIGKSGPPSAIIDHVDVRRMLVQQKAYAEGALALCLFCASLVDGEAAGDANAATLLGLLTPVAKTWPSEFALAACDTAIQVHGGYGYTRDYDVEQLWRDNRLNAIHEGTTGIQAIDLMGRKILHAQEDALAVLGVHIRKTAQVADTDPKLSPLAGRLNHAWGSVEQTVASLRAAPPGDAFNDATLFLRAFGHVVVSWLWLDQALVSTPDQSIRDGKQTACAYMFAYELPQALTWLDLVARRQGLIKDLSPDALI